MSCAPPASDPPSGTDGSAGERAGRDAHLDGHRGPGGHLDAGERHQAWRGAGRAAVHLHHLGARTVALVPGLGRDQHRAVVTDLCRGVAERQRGVAEPEAERVGRGVAVAGEAPVAVPAVVGDRVGVAVEGRQVRLVGGDGERQAAGGLGPAEEHVGERVAALHAGVPGLHDRGHRLPPGLGDDGAAGHDGHDGAGVRRGDRGDERLVVGVQPERGAVAALGEPQIRSSRCRGPTASGAR